MDDCAAGGGADWFEMALQLPAVEPYRTGEDFERWSKGVERYLVALNITESERKCAVLLHLLGPDIADVYDTLPDPAVAVSDAFECWKRKLITYLSPSRNVIAERMTFHNMCMQPGEEFDQFLGRLRVQGRRCGFSVAEQERELRDRCVAGSLGQLREKLLLKAAEKGDDLTLMDIRNAARVYQDVRQLGSLVHGGADASQVQAIHHDASKSTDRKQRQGDYKHIGGAVNEFRGKCFKCGQTGHMKACCPSGAKMTCFQCGKPGHLKRDCSGRKASGGGGRGGRGGQVRQVADQTQCMSSVEPDGLWNVQVGEGSVNGAPTAQLTVNGANIEFVVDTGSPVTIVSDQTLVPGLKLRPSQLVLTSFTGQQVPLAGEADVSVELHGQQKMLRLVVSKLPPHKPLMGREWIDLFQIGLKSPEQVKAIDTSLDQVLQRHANVFREELGKLSVRARLQLKPGAQPVYFPARSVPFALRSAVEKELNRWISEGIAERVDSSHNSGWGTPLVPIPKADGVRLYADYRLTVNPQIVPQRHPTPTPEEVFAGVRGKVFARLDLRDAYLQQELEPDSKDITTVTTHIGRLRMNRLPFGISECCGIFQSAIDQILEGIDGCVAYLDDLLVTGENEADLLKRLDRVLGRLEEHGARLKREKCEFNIREVKYLGWIISADGLKPVPEKVAAVVSMREPRNVNELRALLGSVNYYQRLVPSLASMLAPLYALLKRGATWRWTAACQSSLKQVKRVLTSGNVLMRYDLSLPLKLITDASSVGVGAALVHVLPDGMERPICFASRTLTATEQKYAMVEKETVGVSFGIRRFSQYLYGKHFYLVTDNRALSHILNPQRELPALSAARMQRYALQLAAFSYEVELRKSENMGLADVLSRLPQVEAGGDSVEEADVFLVRHWEDEGPILSAQEVETLTRRDSTLGRVLTYVRSGWPSVVEPEFKAFKQRQNELSTDGDCLMWGGRVVVPPKMRHRVLQELHAGHLGAGKMKQLARRYVWWPGLDAELESLARDCGSCVEKRAAPPKASLHPWEPTQGPWERVHIDFAGPFQGSMFLVAHDSYSKWLEVIPMKTVSAERTVDELRSLFSRLGLPKQVVSDNGPQFTSREMSEFMAMNGVRHIRVAPYHPSSNGAAEKAVQTVKNSLKASIQDGQSLVTRLARFLMSYRNAPQVATGRSPAELLYGRTLRTRLDLLRPDRVQRAADCQTRMAETAGGELRGFGIGEHVWARSFSGPKWRRGRIAAKTGPVSYEVDVGNACWSRHADQLLRAGQSGQAMTQEEDISEPDRPGAPVDVTMGRTLPAVELPAPAGRPPATEAAGSAGVVAPSAGPEEAERLPPPDSPDQPGAPARGTPTRGTCEARGADTALQAERSVVPGLRRSARVRREPDRLVVG